MGLQDVLYETFLSGLVKYFVGCYGNVRGKKRKEDNLGLFVVFVKFIY